MDIKEIQRKYNLKRKDLGEIFNLTDLVYANSTAKKRYEDALCKFYKIIKDTKEELTAKEKAHELVNQYRIILMNEDTDCGNEVLCTNIAVKVSKITCNELILRDINSEYWEKVLLAIK